jgi:predicted Rossmann fold nucleotide-binding protein DprA/Smf involved in DNA uptake
MDYKFIMKLAIIGSRDYKNLERINKILQKYIEKYKDDLIVVSGGCPRGADHLGKQLALELGLKYQEFPPIHARYNEYCVLPASNYGKFYHVNNFFNRNGQIAKYCDHILAFIVEGVKASGTMDTVRKAKKNGKFVLVFEDINDR